jgi:hypothetical protein
MIGLRNVAAECRDAVATGPSPFEECAKGSYGLIDQGLLIAIVHLRPDANIVTSGGVVAWQGGHLGLFTQSDLGPDPPDFRFVLGAELGVCQLDDDFL